MPRPRTDSVKMQFQLPREIYDEMMRLIPEIHDPRRPGTIRNGGAKKYFSSLLLADLARRRQEP